MNRAIIIDDELHCIERLSNLIKNNFSDEVTIMGTFSNFEDSVKAIRELQPDLVFLFQHFKTGIQAIGQRS